MVNALDRQKATSSSTMEHAGSGGNLVNEAWSFAADNIGKPLANAAVFTPWNAIASTTDALSGRDLLPKAELFTLPNASFLSPGWFAQGVSSGVGMIAPYLVAGRLTGCAMRWSGETLAVEGRAGEILQNGKIAQIAGAGIYDGMREPGQGETRLGNSLAGMSMFGIFAYGNALGQNLSLSEQIGKRAVVGFTGAATRDTVSHLVSEQNLPTFSEYLQSGIGGAVLNVALPSAQRALTRTSGGASSSARAGTTTEGFTVGQDVTNPTLKATINSSASDAQTHTATQILADARPPANTQILVGPSEAEQALRRVTDSTLKTEPDIENGGNDSAPIANLNIPRPRVLLARGEGEGDIYDNGDGKVTKIYYDKTVDSAQKRAMYDRLDRMGVKVPKIYDHGTTADGQPALVIERVGDGDSLKMQLFTGELSAADRQSIAKQYWHMADTLQRNGVTVDWNLGNMRFENGTLYLLDPSFIKETPMSASMAEMFGGSTFPRP